MEIVFNIQGQRVIADHLKLFKSALLGQDFTAEDLVKVVTNTAVCTVFDLETAYTFESETSLATSLDLLKFICEDEKCDRSSKLQPQVWSLFKAAIQKSTRNLCICSEFGLAKYLLEKLVSSDSNDALVDLFTEILCIIVPQSISNNELKIIINHLQNASKGTNITWPNNSANLMTVLRQAPFQIGPTEFFDFPGFDRSYIAIPPIAKWPCTNGYTFTTWIRSDPISDIREDKDKPYVYCFRTSKGQGYSAHFVGACLIVTVIKSKNKGYQYSVNFEFKPRVWYMLTLVHIYSRWRNGEIKCYVDGQLVTTVEVNWYVKAGYDAYDKCFIGWAPCNEGDDKIRRYFCGQIGTTYLLSSAMAQSQVEALHQLGPCYTGLFNQQSDTDVCLSEFYNNAIFSQGSLSSEIVFSYSARASQCQVCFFSAASAAKGKETNGYFSHSPHAQLQGDVKAVTTQPVFHSLHSIGGIQILFPLLTQLGLDLDPSAPANFNPAEVLLELVSNLLMRSSQIRQQMVQLKGLMVIGHYFVKYSNKIMSEGLLENVISLSNYFIHIRSEALLKHTIDFLLLNANLWIYAPVQIQITLFTYLSTDFALNCPLFKLSRIRRVSTVLQLLHMLKFYYWVTNPQAKSGVAPKGADGPRPEQTDILTIRSFILLFLKGVITVDGNFVDEEHMQSLLNYLTTLHEEENIHDVLSLLLSITANSPKLTSQALDRKYAVRAIFKILTSPSERIRIKAAKVLIYYMANIPYKRKMDIMVSYGLYELIGQRMMLQDDAITLPTYNVMYEFCTEQTGPQIMENKHAEIDSTTPLINALGLKSIATMINTSRKTLNVFEIKKKFIADMILLFNHNRENRRRLLQCSVWQDWVFSLLHIYPANEREKQITEMVLVLFKILLHHAVKFEYGGWRVWIDTLSIAHFKVSIENYRRSVLASGHHHRKHRRESWRNDTDKRSGGGTSAVQNGPPSQACNKRKDLEAAENLDVQASPGTLPGDVAAVQSQVYVDHILTKSGEKEPSSGGSGNSNDSLKVLGLPQSSINSSVEKNTDENATEKVDSNELPDENAAVQIRKTEIKDDAKPEETTITTDTESYPKEVRFSPKDAQSPRASNELGVKEDAGAIPKSILKSKPSPNHNEAISEGKRRTGKLFRIPPFQWSHLVKRLLSDLIFAIETDVQIWRSQSNKTLVDFLNAADNTTFLHNTVHVISQISDMILYSSGGLVPLLHSATSQSQDNIAASAGLLFDESFSFVHRLLNLVDIFVYSASPRFSSLETEKRMNPGGILRQCLRLVFWAALKNCLECRYKFAKQLVAFEKDIPGEDAAGDFLSGSIQLQAINDLSRLLQDIDISRIRAAIYRETDDIKQSQTVALSCVYFLTLLMVGRYQDILEPSKVTVSPFTKEVMDSNLGSPSLRSPGGPNTPMSCGPEETNENDSPRSNEDKFEDVDLGTPVADADDSDLSKGSKDSKRRQSLNADSKKATLTRTATWSGSEEPESGDRLVTANETETEDLGLGIGASLDLTSTSTTGHSRIEADSFDKLNFAVGLNFNKVTMGNNISKYLENSLNGSSQVLRDLFLDFSQYLSKTLIGSHGQELLNEGLIVMKNSQSAVELVMMLCSQEWQKAIQKHAGGAFLNLENEGRIISSLTADHLIRVADEANEILNREYQDQMARQSEFEARCATHLADRREEETMCDRLIVASRRRDTISSVKCVQKILSSAFSQALWDKKSNETEAFYKIDAWEDNLRRRRRMILNPNGTSHPEATLKDEDESRKDTDADKVEESKSALEDLKVEPMAESQDKVLKEEEENDSLEDNDNDAENQSHLINIPSTTNPVKFQSHECLLIHPCITAPGMLSITTNEIIFDIDEENPQYKKIDPSLIAYCDLTHIKIPFTEIRAIFSRRYLLQNTALEIFVATRSAIMFNLPDIAAVKQAVTLLPRVGIGTKFGAQQTRRYSMASGKALLKLTNMMEKWQKREISNFQYLMFLNTIGGRTFNDLNQYPVFPWVIKDYDSDELDLKSPATFRDLTKPIGAQDNRRAEAFRAKYEKWESDSVPPFHYGTHYSTPGFVLNWMVRCEPFTSMFLNFQGGKFDHADRTFHCVKQAWSNCQRDTSDVKELIPELFYMPEILRNRNKLKFGKLENGEVVNDVILPAWSSSPEDFIRKHRMALESEFVSCQLNHWVDLIFGYKQRGLEAEKAVNVFYHLTYEGSVNFDAIRDPVMLEALQSQIRSFGTTPVQLLAEPHPQRSSILVLNPQLFKQLNEASEGHTVKFLSNSPIVHVAANTHQSLNSPACIALAENMSYSINKWENPNSVGILAKHMVQNQNLENENHLNLKPLHVDSMQVNSTQASYTGRKLCSDLLDTNFTVQKNSFVVTSDNVYVLVCGFWDRSLRVFNLESGKLVQVVFGHYGIVTCVARTENRTGGNSHVVSGSADNTLLVWEWNSRFQCIMGEKTIPGEYPMAKAILMGHESSVKCVSTSSELGIVVSTSDISHVLVHLVNGEFVRRIKLPEIDNQPNCSAISNILLNPATGYIFVVSNKKSSLSVFTTDGVLLASENEFKNARINDVSASLDGAFIIVARDSNCLQVYRSHDLEFLYDFSPQSQDGVLNLNIKSVELSWDNKFVLAGVSNGALWVLPVNFTRWYPEYHEQLNYSSPASLTPTHKVDPVIPKAASEKKN